MRNFGSSPLFHAVRFNSFSSVMYSSIPVKLQFEIYTPPFYHRKEKKNLQLQKRPIMTS